MGILNKIILVIFIFVFIVAIINRVLRNNNEEELMKISMTTTGVITKIAKGGVKSPAGYYYRYSIKNKKYESFDFKKDFNFKLGDSIKIIYATKDNSISKIKLPQ
jgi:hypothetical protein